jgi:hypothetical protein
LVDCVLSDAPSKESYWDKNIQHSISITCFCWSGTVSMSVLEWSLLSSCRWIDVHGAHLYILHTLVHCNGTLMLDLHRPDTILLVVLEQDLSFSWDLQNYRLQCIHWRNWEDSCLRFLRENEMMHRRERKRDDPLQGRNKHVSFSQSCQVYRQQRKAGSSSRTTTTVIGKQMTISRKEERVPLSKSKDSSVVSCPTELSSCAFVPKRGNGPHVSCSGNWTWVTENSSLENETRVTQRGEENFLFMKRGQDRGSRFLLSEHTYATPFNLCRLLYFSRTFPRLMY